MLPAAHRLTDAPDYRHVLRRGRRRAARTLVVSVVTGSAVDGPVDGPDDRPSRLGLVVSRAVGGSVERNRVKRRLRHLAPPRLAALPPGSDVVVRALPASRGASSAVLAADLDQALARCLDRRAEPAR